MARALGLFFFGVAIGSILTLVAQRVRERWNEDDLDKLAERIGERLESLEEDFRPVLKQA